MKVSAVHAVTRPSGLGANKFQFLKSVKEGTLSWWLSVIEIGRAELGLSQLQWAAPGNKMSNLRAGGGTKIRQNV